LAIAAVASAAASFAASWLWGPGTLLSAAVTPVLVAPVSEALRRPVQTVAVTAKRVPALQDLPASQWQHAASARPQRAGALKQVEAERRTTRPLAEPQADGGRRDAREPGASTGGHGYSSPPSMTTMPTCGATRRPLPVVRAAGAEDLGVG
jgi:hypothetical protein